MSYIYFLRHRFFNSCPFYGKKKKYFLEAVDKTPSAALLLRALASVRHEVRVATRSSGAPGIWGFLNGFKAAFYKS
jgi:hypothetical protein